MMCAIFQINTNLLLIQQNINTFRQETLYPSFISKKNRRSPSQTFSKQPLFTTFSLFLTVSEVCNISNKCGLLNKSANKIFLDRTPYTPPSFQKKIALSIAKSFRNILFLPHFYQFSQWLRCAIFQINTDLLVIYQHLIIFTQETL